jgi:hypothetical protein
MRPSDCSEARAHNRPWHFDEIQAVMKVKAAARAKHIEMSKLMAEKEESVGLLRWQQCESFVSATRTDNTPVYVFQMATF